MVNDMEVGLILGFIRFGPLCSGPVSVGPSTQHRSCCIAFGEIHIYIYIYIFMGA